MTNLNNQTKVLWFGDLVTPSGFGRIGNEVTTRLSQRGWQMIGVSMQWDGYPPSPLPYYVRPVGGRDIWQGLGQVIAEADPDIIVCCQDFPYAQTLYHALRIDWSTKKFIVVTPIDGTPVHPEWLKTVDIADATMVISNFGVEALRLEGRAVGLLHPGVDRNEFYPAEDGEVAALREKIGIKPDAFVMGMYAMNQGRKCISSTVAAFKEFALDKPDAVLYLDMDAGSPAGWDIPSLLKQIGLDPARVKYRADAGTAGLAGLRERFLLSSVNSVVSHREGFGLPLLEGMACKVPAMALDWCSGSEICGAEKGVLIRRIPYMEYGTWGGARDAFPDMDDWVKKLNVLYRQPDKRAEIANRGFEWAIQQTWDVAADQFENTLRTVAAQHHKERASEPEPYTIPAPGLSDTRGPAHRDDIGTSVQQPASRDALPGGSDYDLRPIPDANHSDGRLFDGLQPDGAAAPAGDNGLADAA
jgi:glycosyltransferase involved in cell wall biosynthesis